MRKFHFVAFLGLLFVSLLSIAGDPTPPIIPVPDEEVQLVSDISAAIGGVLIIGHGGHGKGTVSDILRETGITVSSSSEFAGRKFIYESIKDQFGYTSFEECYNDRNSSDEMRALWYSKIVEYNKEDPSRLARELLLEYDVYDGMRGIDEFLSCKDINLFSLIVWVDASERLSYREPSSSFKLNKSHADIIVDNNGTKEQLRPKVERLASILT